jgi:hypothetical protein
MTSGWIVTKIHQIACFALNLMVVDCADMRPSVRRTNARTCCICDADDFLAEWRTWETGMLRGVASTSVDQGLLRRRRNRCVVTCAWSLIETGGEVSGAHGASLAGPQVLVV